MKSITIHKLEPDLARSIEERARREGTSVNRLVKTLLRGCLGLDKPAPVDHRHDFADFLGTWSEEEADAFERRVSEFEEIEPAEWQAREEP